MSVVATAAILAACVAEGPPPRPRPGSIPAQPPSLRVDSVFLSAGLIPEDADRNGYYDTINVTTRLFDTSYPFSIAVPGAFEFTITDRAGAPVAAWRFDPPATDAARKHLDGGAAYIFRLDLRAVGTDHVDASEGLLGCTFTPADGPVIRSSVVTVFIGRTR